MSQAILHALSANEPAAFAAAKTWMAHCDYSTLQGWVAYSKLMQTYLQELAHYHLSADAYDNARQIVRYYALALDRLHNKPWHHSAFLELHRTVEMWTMIPGDVWVALHEQRWNPTPLFQWSLDNEDMQLNVFSALPSNQNHTDALHVRMAIGILEQCFKELPILVDTCVHWNLWTVFQNEHAYLPRNKLDRRIALLSQATPISFEHAVTEFYQHSKHPIPAKTCKHLLRMDMSHGDSLTTCSGLLLLYHRFRARNKSLFDGIQKRYPELLGGFDVHLGMHSDVDHALLNACDLMNHWMRCVHGKNSASDACIELPEELEAVV